MRRALEDRVAGELEGRVGDDAGMNCEVLDELTTTWRVVKLSNMKAIQLMRQRIEIHTDAFAELVIWQSPVPSDGSAYPFKYCLTSVVQGMGMLRYDNEAGKGDHRHTGELESPYVFSTPRQLMADFFNDIQRIRHEHADD